MKKILTFLFLIANVNFSFALKHEIILAYVGGSGSNTVAYYKSKANGIMYHIDETKKTASTMRPSSGVSYDMESITIPDTVTYNMVDYVVTAIGFQTFLGGNSTKSIHLPKTIQSLDYESFGTVDFLKGITTFQCDATTPPDLNRSVNPLRGISYRGASCKVIVPCGNVAAYEEKWEIVKDQLVGSDNYTIMFKNYNGTLLQTLKNVGCDVMPSYSGSVPTRASSDQYTYTFKGWTPNVEVATANATYTATYTQTLRQYNVVWKNFNGTTLQSESVNYGIVPSYMGALPSKPSSAQYTYNFKGWKPAIVSVTTDVTYIAEYDSVVNKKTITAQSSDTNMGTVSGGGTYAYNAIAKLTATSADGYTFARWSDGNTENPRTVTVTQDSVLIAEFEEVEAYTLTVLSNNAEYGTVTGGGTYRYGEEVVITAIPRENQVPWTEKATLGDGSVVDMNARYYLRSWSDNGSREKERTITVTRDSLLTASFNKGITIRSDEGMWLTQYPTMEYFTTMISLGVNSSPLYFQQVTDEIKVKFEWEQAQKEKKELYDNGDEYVHKLTLLTNDSNRGEVSGAGYYYQDEEAILEATPTIGYAFVQWNDGNMENPRTLTMINDRTYMAIFEATFAPSHEDVHNGYIYVDLGLPSGLKWATCNVGAENPWNYGNYYAWGETSTKSVYNWSTYLGSLGSYSDCGTDKDMLKDVSDISGTGYDAATVNMGGKWRMPTREEQRELFDNCYLEWTNNYCGTGIGGWVVYKVKNVSDKGKEKWYSKSGGGYYGGAPIATYTLSDVHMFLPATGYYSDSGFAGAGSSGGFWSSSISDSSPSAAFYIYFSASGAYADGRLIRPYGHSVRGVCPKFEYLLTVQSADTNMGTVSGGGTYAYNATAKLTATPSEGYEFVRWSDGNTENPRTVTVTQDCMLVAEFEECETVTVTLTKTIQKGSSFTIGEHKYSERGTYSETFKRANGCDSIVVLKLNVVRAVSYTLRVVADDSSMGTVNGTGAYKQGTPVTVVATPSSDAYVFVHWEDNEEDIQVNENPYTFVLNRNLLLRAVFRKASEESESNETNQ